MAASLLLASGASGATIASSKFSDDTDGWKVIGDTQSGSEEATHVATGGDPGGYASIDDAATGGVMFWRAPKAFRRDAFDAFKGQLRYSQRQSTDTNQFVDDQVVLEGDGKRMVFNAGPYPPVAPTWGRYVIPLSKSGWVNATGDPTDATNQEMKDVLRNLDRLLIRAEYQDGPDTDDLDSVSMRDTPAP